MRIQVFNTEYSVCKVKHPVDLDFSGGFVSVTRTEDEISVVCETACIPKDAVAEEPGWNMLKICGELDFTLVGVIARITGALSEAGISVFTVSTYNTDYILLKAERLKDAVNVLTESGYQILPECSD